MPNEFDQESFDSLLSWLHPDREVAGQVYETLHRDLIKMFVWTGCRDAEGLADKTINVVVKKLPELENHYKGDPRLYFYGVARNLIKQEQELIKRRKEINIDEIDMHVAISDIETEAETEKEDCLLKCLELMSADNRDFLLRYYEGDRHAKIEMRQRMSSELGISTQTLRVRAFRLRATLERCLRKCLGEELGY